MLAGIVVAFHLIVSFALIYLVLRHAGRGGGMSDMFGGGMSSGSFSGSVVIEKNLDRITVGVAVLFSVTTLSLTWIWR